MKKGMLRRLLALVAFLTLLPACAWAAYPAEVPRTGQTACYDDNGTEINCAGTGQDGDIQAGVAWPDPRFIDNFDGTVTDSLTGLEWTKNANPVCSLTGWSQALAYIKRLNRQNYLGHDDWRLPNVNELESLVDAGQSDPALPPSHPFKNVQQFFFYEQFPHFSSTTATFHSVAVWGVNLFDGLVKSYDKPFTFDFYYGPFGTYVWPVRAGQCGALETAVICLPRTGQTACYDVNGAAINCAGTGQDGDIQAGVAWPDPRFIDNGDGTVTDSLTGLEWTKNANPAGDAMTWPQALGYVKTLTTGGHSDWRLPNKNELRSLADYGRYNPALPQDSTFTNIQANGYWSSTSIPFYTFSAWVVDLGSGSVKDYYRCQKHNSLYDYYVWPVRAGQVDISTPSTTTTTVPGSTSPATQVLGADSPLLENLRVFRDSSLGNSSVGRRIIDIYYANAGSITAVLERSPELRAVARRVLATIAPLVGRN